MRGAQIIAKNTKASELTGALIIVHNVNVPGFINQTAFYNPLDGINLNRIWPGNLESGIFYGAGSISHYITNAIYEKIQKKATHYMDMHGGDLTEDIPHFAASVMIGDNKVDETSRMMLKYSLAKYIREGDPSPGHTTTSAAELKIPNILHEAGRAGMLEKEDVKKHFNAIQNIMKYLGMIEGKPIEPEKQIKIKRGPGVRAKHGGFFESLVSPGDIVSEGQKIGKIYNVFGDTIEEIKSPTKGMITIINFRSAKSVGERLFSISEIVN
jgi:predicted deacylase